MRQDQYEKLQKLSEKLADVLIEELDPTRWIGAGIHVANMDRDTRGDNYWCKKSAGMTLTVLTKLHTVIGMVQRAAPPPAEDQPGEGEDMDAEIATAEAEALRAIEAAQRRAKRGGKPK